MDSLVTLDVYPRSLFRKRRYEVNCREHGQRKRTTDHAAALKTYQDHVRWHPHYHLLVANDNSKRQDAYDGPFQTLSEAHEAALLRAAALKREGFVQVAELSWSDKLTPMAGVDIHLKSGAGKLKIVRTVPCLEC